MSATGQARPDTDNAWLDLVRSVAILLVLARHGQRAIGAATDAAPSGFLETLAVNGWVGVDLFFVLSGYLITQHLLREGLATGGFSYVRYVVLRGLRIVPAYVAVLAMVVLAVFPLYAISRDQLGLRIAYHLLFLQDYLPANINVVFWSLGVEIKFYLIAPALLFIALRLRRLGAALLLLAAVAAMAPVLRGLSYLFVEQQLTYQQMFEGFRSPFHASLEPLIAGMAIALAQHKGLVRFDAKTGGRLMWGGLALFAAWLASHELLAVIDWRDVVVQPTLIAGFSGAITLGAAMMKGAQVPFEGAVRLVARLSYSLYLVHYPLIPLALAVGGASTMPGVVFWAIYLSTSMALAWAIYTFVERPCLDLRHVLLARRAAAH